MFGIGAPEIIIIVLIVLLLFGGKSIPEITKSVGTAAKEFRDGYEEGEKQKDEKPS